MVHAGNRIQQDLHQGGHEGVPVQAYICPELNEPGGDMADERPLDGFQGKRKDLCS